MNSSFIGCFSAEWIKKRRSFSSWLIIAGGLFVPMISVIIFMVYPKQLLAVHASGHFWDMLFQKSWQMMAFMLLPMGLVLAVSLVTQLEFKNNTWKQLHASPVLFSHIYFSKLLVLLLMLIQLFLTFNAGILVSAWIPSLLVSEIPYPDYAFNFGNILSLNAGYFICSLPLLALQYMISMQFRNFLVPVGAGLALIIGSMIALTWKYIYMIPSAYTALYFLQSAETTVPAHNLSNWSLGYFLTFTLLGYWLYISRKVKG